MSLISMYLGRLKNYTGLDLRDFQIWLGLMCWVERSILFPYFVFKQVKDLREISWNIDFIPCGQKQFVKFLTNGIISEVDSKRGIQTFPSE